MKDALLCIVFFIVFSVVIFLAIWKATSPECWYSGMHDSQCEILDGNKECRCYERFVASEKSN